MPKLTGLRVEASKSELMDLKMYQPLKQCLSPIVLVLCSLALTACMSSDKGLMDADTRVLPFTPPITLEVYDRKNASEPWRKEKDPVTLIADGQLLVRLKNETSGDTYSFHQLEPGRFIVEATMKSSGRFFYSVLEVRNGEGLLHYLDCENIDQAAFGAAGGTVIGIHHKECKLDKIANPLAFLKSLAAKPTGWQQRFVPVR